MIGSTYIIEDREFSECNSIFAAQCVVLKKLVLAQVKHYPAISDKPYYGSDVLSFENPVSLQRKVFLELVLLHFCRRAMENLPELTIDDFVVEKFGNDAECVKKATENSLKIIARMTKIRILAL